MSLSKSSQDYVTTFERVGRRSWCQEKVLLISFAKHSKNARELVNRIIDELGLGHVSIVDLTDTLQLPIDLVNVREIIVDQDGTSVDCQRLVMMNGQYPSVMHTLVENSMSTRVLKVFFRVCGTGINADIV